MIRLLAALLLMGCTAFAADNQYIAKVIFTANPADGNSVTVNGNTFTFKSTVTTPSSQVFIGADATDTAANLAQHFRDYPVTGISPQVDSGASTNVYLIADAINSAITTSVSGAWGTANVSVTSLVLFTAQLPLSAVQKLTHRTNLANWLILGMRDYATTNFPAGSPVFTNYVDRATDQTIAGAKTFTGITTLSNSANALVGGSISNAFLKAVSIQFDNTNRNGVEFYASNNVRFSTIAPDLFGVPTLYFTGVNEAPTNELGAYTPSGGNLLTRNAADTYYGRLGNSNSWTGSNYMVVLRSPSIQGVITDASGTFSTITASNMAVIGAIRITNASPSIWIQDSNATENNKNTEITAFDGAFTILAWDDEGSSSAVVMDVDRNGSEINEIDFPNGVLVPDKLRVTTGLYALGTAGFAGIVGVGTTNPSAPTSMDAGLIFTNSIAPSADPENGFAMWSENGEPHYRNPTGGNKSLDNASGSSIGSGSDYFPTTTYAEASFGSAVTLTLPTAGTYLITGTATLEGDASVDDCPVWVKLYNSTDAADISGSERMVSALPATRRNQAQLISLVTVTASKTIRIYAKKGSTPSGSPAVIAAQTSLAYVRLN